MSDDRSRPAPSQESHPVHGVLAQFPVVCFTGALITDLAYWRTTAVMWETFSIWLITAGLVFGGLAVVAGLVDFGGSRLVRRSGTAWLHALGTLIVLGLALVNAFVHSRDGYTAVVPQGMFLSALVVLILFATSWLGHIVAYRRAAGRSL